MNLVFASLLVILSLIFIKKAILKKSKKTVKDERTELIGLKASRITFIIITDVLAISSFLLIYFGQHGRVPSSYIYYLGVIMSYLTCLVLILYIILYAYFNKSS